MNSPDASPTANPLVSVVVPVYNRGAQVQSTIDSVLAQTLCDIEIIVVDDGSTDQTPDILRSLYGADERVRLFFNANGGVAVARNFGLEKANAEFIAYLDHDDLWKPQKLEKQFAAFQGKPEVGVVYCLWEHVDEQGNIWGHRENLEDPTWRLPEGDIAGFLIRRNFIVSMSIPLCRTRLLRQIGGFDAAMVPCDDGDLWLRLAFVCHFAGVYEILVAYRHHSGQQSGSSEAMLKGKRRIFVKHWRKTIKHPRAVWIALSDPYFYKTAHPFYERAQNAIKRSQWGRVAREIIVCLSRHPFALFTPQWIYILLRLVRRDSRPF